MAAKKKKRKSASEKGRPDKTADPSSTGIPVNPEEMKRISLAFRILESSRWLWGDLDKRRPSRSLKRRILHTLGDIFEAAPLTKESVLRHIGLSPDRYDAWLRELPVIEESLRREDSIRRQWLTLLQSRKFWTVYGGVSAAAAFLSYHYADKQIFHFMEGFSDHSVTEFFRFYTMTGESFFYLLFTFAGFLFARNANYMAALKSLYVFSSVLLSGIAVNLLKPVFGRSRPELLLSEDRYGFHLFAMDIFRSSSYAMQSFPSGHAATGMALAVSLSLLFPRLRYLWIAFGLSIGLSRIIVDAHFLSDVIIGAAIGVAGAAIAHKLTFRRERDESLYQ